MGISDSFEKSFVKSQIAAKNILPSSGTVFISLADADKGRGIELAKKFENLGFEIVATGGTYKTLAQAGVKCEMVYKISEGRPNIEDKLKNSQIALAVNTSDSKSSTSDAVKIRQAVLRFKIPYFTNMNAALKAAESISSNEAALEVKSLQEYLNR
jgi:carbamoyl-phosphate synthase large subunit